jgi:hypothetical protein
VYTIEQLPNNGGFRVYQSYAQAYSLRSWLAESVPPRELFEEGQLMLNEELKGIVNSTLMLVTLGRNSIDNIYEPPLPPILDPIFPYIEYVALYDEQQVVENLLKAANAFGHGQIIDARTFEAQFVAQLAEMTSYLQANSGSSVPFSERIFNMWIDLHASPNPLHFPGVAHDAISNILLPGREFAAVFNVKKLRAEELNAADCVGNARQILKSLP